MQKQSIAAGKQPRFCNLCGQPLVGRYYRHGEGIIFCAACYANRSRCARCGAPLDDTALARGRGQASEYTLSLHPLLSFRAPLRRLSAPHRRRFLYVRGSLRNQAASLL